MKKVGSVIFILTLLLMLMEQCKHEPAETPRQNVTTIDSTHNNQNDTTKKPPAGTGDSACFNTQILPLVLSTCALGGCHDAHSASKGYVFTNYANTKKYAAVINSVTVRATMPRNLPRWTPVQTALFQKWIAEGARDVECSTTICDTSNVTYTTQIQPIVQNYCLGCHTASTANSTGGGIILDNYTALKSNAQTGHLLCAIQWTGTCYHMPNGSAQLGNCEIRKFVIWTGNNCPL